MRRSMMPDNTSAPNSSVPTVGIVTWHCLLNVGSNLQAYGLFSSIEKLGYRASFINYRKPYQKENPLVAKAKDLMSRAADAHPGLLPPRLHYGARGFQRTLFRQTEVAYHEEGLAPYSSSFDVYVSGSDQIWSPKRFNPVYFLSFVKGDKPKMSYATSVGTESIPDELKARYKELLSDYLCLSVREDNASEYLSDMLGRKVLHVLDPCFLLEGEEWRALEKPLNTPRNYVFCYLIGRSEKYRRDVMEHAKRVGLRVVAYSEDPGDAEWADIHYSRLDPREFVYLVRNSEVVMTDSYHGMVFSLIFERQFVPFLRFSREDAMNENSRVLSLLRQTSLTELLVDEEATVIQPSIDYASVGARLSSLKEGSRKYLDTSLVDCLVKRNA